MNKRNLPSSLLLICQGYPPYYGGAEGAAAGIASEAAESAGFNVSVLTSDIGGRLRERETINGVSVFRIPAMKREWSRHTVPELLSFYISAIRRLQHVHKDVCPDYVLGVFTMPAGLIALRYSRKFKIPYSVILQGSDVPGYQPGRFRLLHPIMRFVARRVWSNAEHVFAVGSPLKELALQTWPEGNIEVIPNGVDTDAFHPSEKQNEDGERLRMVVVSQLIERKGIQYLLEALSGLTPELLSRLNVDVYGSGDFLATLEAQVRSLGLSEIVSFCGLLETEELSKKLRNADLFVLPSLQEGLPLALLEAMACGLPVVATSVGDVPVVVIDGVNGRLVPPADSRSLCCAISELLENSDSRVRLGAQARPTAEKYSWRAIWTRYANTMFEEAVDAGGHGEAGD